MLKKEKLKCSPKIRNLVKKKKGKGRLVISVYNETNRFGIVNSQPLFQFSSPDSNYGLYSIRFFLTLDGCVGYFIRSSSTGNWKVTYWCQHLFNEPEPIMNTQVILYSIKTHSFTCLNFSWHHLLRIHS